MNTDPRIEAVAEEVRKMAMEEEGIPLSPWRLSVAQEAYRKDARRILAAVDKAATITTTEELNALPVGARVVMGDYYILREESPVGEGVWLDLGNGLRLDAVDLRIIMDIYPARVLYWGTE